MTTETGGSSWGPGAPGGGKLRHVSLALVVVLLAAAPLLASAASVTAPEVIRHVTRVVASPTPLPAPLDALAILSDRVVWRVDVDPSAVVVVDASSADAAPFYLRFHPWGQPTPQSPMPGARQSPTLNGAQATAWLVEVDPALGVDVDVTVRFHGHVGGSGGGAWPFTLTDVQTDRGCAREMCLP